MNRGSVGARHARASLLVAALLFPAPMAAQEAVEERLGSEYQLLRVERVAEGLAHPWGIASLPDGSLLVTERPGRLVRIHDEQVEEVAGLPEIHAVGQGGLLDVVLHPEFEQNGWVYLTYSKGGPEGTVLALARGRLHGDKLEDLEELFASTPEVPPGGHYGSRILFLEDGTLLVSVGDRGRAPLAADSTNTSGAVVRLTDDGGIPSDNPFLGVPGATPELFSYGHRNVQGLARDPETGAIWATEHGPRGGDELNLLEAGAHYGWPHASLGREYPTQAPAGRVRTAPGTVDPVFEFVPTLAPSGLTVVRGGGFHDTWQGNLLVGGLRAERVLRLVVEDGQVVHGEELVAGTLGRIRDVHQAVDGAIYLAVDRPEGSVYRIVPAPLDETRVVARLRARDDYGIFVGLLEAMGIHQALDSPGPFTIFAPTDDAFEALPAGVLDALREDHQRLGPLLAAHVAPGHLSAEELEEAEEVVSVSGERWGVRLGPDGLVVGAVRIVFPDVEASNGVIHGVDGLLLEPTSRLPPGAPDPSPASQDSGTGR